MRRRGKAVHGTMFRQMVVLFLCGLMGGNAQAEAREYTFATDDTQIRIAVQDNGLRVVSLKRPQNPADWIAGSEDANADASFLPLIDFAEVGGSPVRLQWRFTGGVAPEGLPRRYILTFVNASPALELKSIWTYRSGPGPIEHSFHITNKSGLPVQLPLQNSLIFAVRPPAGHTLENWWVEKGANTPTAQGVHRTRVEADFHQNLLSLPYAREPEGERDAIPWTSMQDVVGGQGWYAGVEFSGRVHIALKSVSPAHAPDGQPADATPVVRAEMGFDPNEASPFPYRTRLEPGDTLEVPTVFLGCYTGDVDDGANVLRRWVEKTLRPSVSDTRYPLLVNNSWGSGMAVDEKLARQMIEDSADLGLEMFHVDAGWFRGVGDWRADPSKFPQGLAPIAGYAHAKGLKFGLWVGWTQGGNRRDPRNPRAILSVREAGMKPWFTRDYPVNWKPGEFTGADVCLADPQAEAWCLQELKRILAEDKIDLLEHDQRMIVDACDQISHRHTVSPTDIAYQATLAYYRIYDTLRASHPGLLLENCVNGGHMVDYGVVQRTHYVSITDTYDPLSNRRAFFDASYALPPAMCECYIANTPVASPEAFKAMLRSGMMGWCTLMCDTSKWTAAQRKSAKRQIAIYKTWLRPLIVAGNLYHVSERPDGIHWDGIQYADPKTGRGVLYAFRGKTETDAHTFLLKGLEPSASYRVTFEDGSGMPALRTGEDLMRNGLILHLSVPQSSELAYLEKQ